MEEIKVVKVSSTTEETTCVKSQICDHCGVCFKSEPFYEFSPEEDVTKQYCPGCYFDSDVTGGQDI